MSIPRRHIIVGFDGSQAAGAALAWAVEEAGLHDAELTAWTVLEQQLAAAGKQVDERDNLRALQQAVREITDGVPTGFRLTRGGAAAELTAACTSGDLLVVGSRGRSQLTGLLLGSVSRACLHHAPCPVVVVRPGPHPVRPRGRVLVGVDGSRHALKALRVAAGEARARRAVLQAIHVVHWDRLGVELLAPTPRELVAWGKRLVAKQLREADVAARPVIVHGHTSEVLVRYSTRVDLLVLGSRGRGPLTSLLLGSTSEYCALHARCPVMIVRGNAQPSDSTEVAVWTRAFPSR